MQVEKNLSVKAKLRLFAAQTFTELRHADVRLHRSAYRLKRYMSKVDLSRTLYKFATCAGS